MPFVKDEPMGWEECGNLIKAEIRKVEDAIALDGDIAVTDTYPIRSLYSTFNGYGPYLHPRAGELTPGERPQRIEDIHGVPEEFRLAICLEHSISLIVSDLIRRYYVDRTQVRRLNRQAVDIQAAQSILLTLKTLIFSYRQQFVRFGVKYAAVRRSCHEVFLQWNDSRVRVRPVCKSQQFFFSFLGEL
jgi:hypothetical protein